MEIYVAHLRNFDANKNLYEFIRKSPLNEKHTFVLPHEKSCDSFKSKEYFQGKCNLVIAEVSNPSISLGIELGWADVYGVPIVCIYRAGSKLPNSLKVISDNFIEYSNGNELISKLEVLLDGFGA